MDLDSIINLLAISDGDRPARKEVSQEPASLLSEVAVGLPLTVSGSSGSISATMRWRPLRILEGLA